jgi:hypothetical protein
MNISKEIAIAGGCGIVALLVLISLGVQSGLLEYLFKGNSPSDDQLVTNTEPRNAGFGNLLVECKFTYPITCDGKTSFVRDATFISAAGGTNPLNSIYYQILTPGEASGSAAEPSVTRTGPALVFYVATEEGINPYIMLTLLELDKGIVLGDATTANYATMDGAEFYNYLIKMAGDLHASYEARQSETGLELTSYYAKSAGKTYSLPSTTTPASLAILDYLDTIADSGVEFEKLTDSQAGFLALYRRLSQDDSTMPAFTSPAAY